MRKLLLGLHGQGIVRADIEAQRAARAVGRRHLDPVLEAAHLAPALGRDRHKGLRGSLLLLLGNKKRAEALVRAGHNAVVALRARLRLPDRQLRSQVALLVLRRSGRNHTLQGEGRHGQRVALEGVHGKLYVRHKLRKLLEADEGVLPGDGRQVGLRGLCPCRRNLDAPQRALGQLHGAQVLLHDPGALPAVALLNGMLQEAVGLCWLDDTGQRKEHRLHHHVDAARHSCLLGNPAGVNCVHGHLPVREVPPEPGGEARLERLGRGSPGVDDEDSALLDVLDHRRAILLEV
mmetsp:Transcript_6936/g.20458  ORF Transcript_6936/g.20458 Transcript_6936/m.20458 type:complete len:291 (-) Transcript_6936:285-1157(-)